VFKFLFKTPFYYNNYGSLMLLTQWVRIESCMANLVLKPLPKVVKIPK
jgi:hypothetical protein